MDRRRLLAATGGLVSLLAGCTGGVGGYGGGGGDATATDTDTDTEPGPRTESPTDARTDRGSDPGPETESETETATPTDTPIETATPTPTETATATPTSSPQVDETIAMKNTAFQPETARVGTDATVEWVNSDAFAHDVTATTFHERASDWEFETTLSSGESATYTFEESGVYEYYCTIHGEGTMCGAVLVGGATLDATLPCHEEGDGDEDSGGYY